MGCSACTHTHTHTTPPCAHMHRRANTGTHRTLHIYTHTSVQTHRCTHALPHAHTRPCAHTSTHCTRYTYTYVLPHKHTPLCVLQTHTYTLVRVHARSQVTHLHDCVPQLHTQHQGPPGTAPCMKQARKHTHCHTRHTLTDCRHTGTAGTHPHRHRAVGTHTRLHTPAQCVLARVTLSTRKGESESAAVVGAAWAPLGSLWPLLRVLWVLSLANQPCSPHLGPSGGQTGRSKPTPTSNTTMHKQTGCTGPCICTNTHKNCTSARTTETHIPPPRRHKCVCAPRHTQSQRGGGAGGARAAEWSRADRFAAQLPSAEMEDGWSRPWGCWQEPQRRLSFTPAARQGAGRRLSRVPR